LNVVSEAAKNDAVLSCVPMLVIKKKYYFTLWKWINANLWLLCTAVEHEVEGIS